MNKTEARSLTLPLFEREQELMVLKFSSPGCSHLAELLVQLQERRQKVGGHDGAVWSRSVWRDGRGLVLGELRSVGPEGTDGERSVPGAAARRGKGWSEEEVFRPGEGAESNVTPGGKFLDHLLESA